MWEANGHQPPAVEPVPTRIGGVLMTGVLVRTFGDVASGDGRTLFGVAVPFGQVAEVNDGFGPYRETFTRGAFARSIAERGHRVKLAVNHDLHRRLPVGRVTRLFEDSDGLRFEARVSETQAGDEVLELVRDGALDGVSINFEPLRERRRPDGVIERTEVKLGRELSVTPVPVYPGALIAGVRSESSWADAARRRLSLIEKAW